MQTCDPDSVGCRRFRRSLGGDYRPNHSRPLLAHSSIAQRTRSVTTAHPLHMYTQAVLKSGRRGCTRGGSLAQPHLRHHAYLPLLFGSLDLGRNSLSLFPCGDVLTSSEPILNRRQSSTASCDDDDSNATRTLLRTLDHVERVTIISDHCIYRHNVY
jgi:hypothetical protein